MKRKLIKRNKNLMSNRLSGRTIGRTCGKKYIWRLVKWATYHSSGVYRKYTYSRWVTKWNEECTTT